MTPETCLLEIYKTDRKATVSQGRVGANHFIQYSPISGIFDKGISACHRKGNTEKKEHLGSVLSEVAFFCGPMFTDKNQGEILILTRGLCSLIGQSSDSV